jgi:LPXTG-site transpeptidase (sortase) family protein
VVCAVGIGYPLWWMHRSETGGAALLNQAKTREGLTPSIALPSISPVARTVSTCVERFSSSGQPEVELPAILDVPSIGLQAPVMNGVTDAILNDSVGHYPSTTWPGEPGISILLAHDASYFSNLGGVHVGDFVSWIDDCQQSTFRVNKIEVVKPGTPLPQPPGGKGIALITCSPADALFWTPDRLVVLASYVGAEASGTVAAHPPPPLGITLPLPSGLHGADLTLSSNGLLVGSLAVNGKPLKNWSESADPLRAAQVAFRGLAAAMRALDAGEASWWSSLALPGVPMPSSIPTQYEYNALITVIGSHVTAIQLQSPLATVDFVVKSTKLYIASLTLTY